MLTFLGLTSVLYTLQYSSKIYIFPASFQNIKDTEVVIFLLCCQSTQHSFILFDEERRPYTFSFICSKTKLWFSIGMNSPFYFLEKKWGVIYSRILSIFDMSLIVVRKFVKGRWLKINFDLSHRKIMNLYVPQLLLAM